MIGNKHNIITVDKIQFLNKINPEIKQPYLALLQKNKFSLMSVFLFYRFNKIVTKKLDNQLMLSDKISFILQTFYW